MSSPRTDFNSSLPSAAYMRLQTGSVLVHPSHFLNQCWFIINLTLTNKLQWNSIRNTKLFFMKMHLKMSSVKWRSFCPGGDELLTYTTFFVHKRYIIHHVLTAHSRPVPVPATIHTVRCRYNAVNFLQIPHNRHPVTLGPWARDVGRTLWFYHLLHFLPLIS